MAFWEFSAVWTITESVSDQPGCDSSHFSLIRLLLFIASFISAVLAPSTHCLSHYTNALLSLRFFFIAPSSCPFHLIQDFSRLWFSGTIGNWSSTLRADVTLRSTDIFNKQQPSLPLPFMSEERQRASQDFSPPGLHYLKFELWLRVLMSQGISSFGHVSVFEKKKNFLIVNL